MEDWKKKRDRLLDTDDNHVMIASHRGKFSSSVMENTSLAFLLAVAQGADMVEMDLEMTRDGVLVGHHDKTMQRLFHENEKICDYTLEELQQKPLYNYVGEICEEHIETFEEILKSLKEKTMVPALEILPEKQTDEVFQKETFQWLRDHRIKVWCNSLSLAKRLVYGAGYDDLNIVLGALGLPTPSWISDPNFIMISLIIVGVWSGIGYNTIILLAAIQGISQEMYESADLDGASEFQKFWKITLPLVSPSMFFLLTMGIMKAMRAFDMIYMFIGKDAWSTGGPLLEAVRTMVYGIYFNGFTRMDMGMASAESVVLFVMILIVTAIQFKLQDKWVNYD